MNAKTNAQGKERKNLVKAIAEVTGQAAKYNGAPAFTYTVGNYTIERDGSITTEDETGMQTLATGLRNRGFEIAMPEIKKAEPKQAATEEMDESSWTLTMPRADFTDEQIANLEKIIASKADLIRKALDCEDPIVILTEDRVAFPWYKRMLGSSESTATMAFIDRLCRMAKNSKRITAKEKEVPNAKYTFRCFLLRLGFIGAEYKNIRKSLLKRLEGSSAFRTIKNEQAETAEQEA
ncbi:MAG: amidoligase family protein [Acidaminococcaceae bacterium]|nr:amidoligase family protein [Acidaminococcaceae bacterium]